MEASTIITLLLVILCLLASIDLYNQFSINSDEYWFNEYTLATRSSNDMWKLGYRIEDLEIKLASQNDYIKSVRHTLNNLAPRFRLDTQTLRSNLHDFTHTRQARVAMHDLLYNESSVYQIRCEEDGPLIRVGVNDYRTDQRDCCQIFTGTTADLSGPITMFELVPLDSGSIAIKSLANGLYVKAVPPPPDSSSLPWKLVIGGLIPGSSERFRITDDGYIYSPIMEGFFQCNTGQMVSGYSGKYGNFNKFKMQLIKEEDIINARELVSLSNQIINIQKIYSKTHQTSEKDQKLQVNKINGLENSKPVKICMAVPVTSKGTQMSSVSESPFWSNLFDSFMKSIDWRSNRYEFEFYIGFDKADDMYDTGDSWSEMRSEFKTRAEFRMKEQLMDDAAINFALEKQLTLKLQHFEHLQGSPTQVVSQLVLAAYVDNFDYFYQVNDDTQIVSSNWVPLLIEKLASNPFIPNFGVTGPKDSNNDKIFTHSFVHRTHIEVFGFLFPPSFKNWWSDDWISTVYGKEHTFRSNDVEIMHNVGAQKEKGSTRYEIDKGAQLILNDELMKGHVQIDSWLKKQSLPRLPLPNICGYAPLTRYIKNELIAKTKQEEIKLNKNIFIN